MRLGSRGECYFMRTDSNRRTVAAVAGDTGVSSTPPPQTESLDSSVGARRPRAPPLAAIHASSTSTLHEQVRSLLRFLLASSRTALTRAHTRTHSHTLHLPQTDRVCLRPERRWVAVHPTCLAGLTDTRRRSRLVGTTVPARPALFTPFPGNVA